VSVVAAGGGTFGQGFASENCANWTVRVDNDSSEEVVGLTYRARAGEFEDASFTRTREVDRPSAVSLRLSIPAHGTQDVRFQSCTPSRVPAGYEYNELPPERVTVRWLNGFVGDGCFGRC
jgi:hypothetical protein